MTHRRGFALGLLIVLGGMLAHGCTTFQGIRPSDNGPTRASAVPRQLRLGMESFIDARPEDERSVIDRSAIRLPVPRGEVTAKLVEDLRASQMFTDVDFPVPSAHDHLIMKGEIRQFSWQFTTNPLLLIPIVNLSTFVGVPVEYEQGVVHLSVQVLNAKTSEVMAVYDTCSVKTASYVVYDFKAREPGATLADALSDASQHIQAAVLMDLKAGRFAVARQ
jgi:hypothetical protein